MLPSEQASVSNSSGVLQRKSSSSVQGQVDRSTSTHTTNLRSNCLVSLGICLVLLFPSVFRIDAVITMYRKYTLLSDSAKSRPSEYTLSRAKATIVKPRLHLFDRNALQWGGRVQLTESDYGRRNEKSFDFQPRLTEFGWSLTENCSLLIVRSHVQGLTLVEISILYQHEHLPVSSGLKAALQNRQRWQPLQFKNQGSVDKGSKNKKVEE